MAKYSSEDAFYKRLNQLAETTKTPVNESRTIGTLVNYERGADGLAYGIIKENHNYYIKKAGIKSDLNVSDFAYIGGLENITNYQYPTLANADKQRNMMITNLNESVKLNAKLNKKNTKININEDVAGEEIEQAQQKIPDLDAAADAENTGMDSGMGVDNVSPDGIDQTTPEIPDLGDGDSIPEPTGENPSGDEGGLDAPMGSETTPTGEEGGEMPMGGGEEGGEEMPTGEEGGEEGPIDGATMTTDDANQSDIEKGLGKLTNTIRKTEMEPVEVKSALNTFIAAFKDKLPELEIEDRKAIANKIIKVVAGGEEDLEASMPDEEPVEEQQCAECGGFTQYAESRGYTKESIMECDNEEMGNLIGGYATAHGEGKNSGDGETVSLFTNDEIAESLINEYGHDAYVNEILKPHMNKLMEGTTDDTLTKINELSWTGIKNAANSFGSGVKNAAAGVKNAASAAVSGVGQGKVSDIGANIKKGVGDVGASVKQGVQNVGAGMQQGYNKGVQSDEIQSIDKLAQDLKVKFDSLNAATVKAGGQPMNPTVAIDRISNILTGSVPPQISNNPSAQKMWKRANTNFQNVAVKENIDESAMINTNEPFKKIAKSPPPLPGKKKTEIMAGGTPSNNTTAFKLIGKSAPAQPSAGKKTVMGEGEVVESVNADAKPTTAVTTAKVANSGEVNKTGFKIIGKNPPALPGKLDKTIMGEADAGYVDVQPNMVNEVEDELEPTTDVDDVKDVETPETSFEVGGEEGEETHNEPDADDAEEEKDFTFAPEGQSMGLMGTSDAESNGTINIDVDGNSKKLNIQINEIKTGMKIINEMMQEISTGLAQKASNVAQDAVNFDDPILAQKKGNQSREMGSYINPQLRSFLASKGIPNIGTTGDGLLINLPSKNGDRWIGIYVNKTGYKLGGGDTVYDLKPEMIQVLPTVIKRIQADLNGQSIMNPSAANQTQIPAPANQLEETPMSISESKVREYVRKRIEEKQGLRKPSLNEGTKSNKLKELDRMIDEQEKIFKSVVKKK